MNTFSSLHLPLFKTFPVNNSYVKSAKPLVDQLQNLTFNLCFVIKINERGREERSVENLSLSLSKALRFEIRKPVAYSELKCLYCYNDLLIVFNSYQYITCWPFRTLQKFVVSSVLVRSMLSSILWINLRLLVYEEICVVTSSVHAITLFFRLWSKRSEYLVHFLTNSNTIIPSYCLHAKQSFSSNFL